MCVRGADTQGRDERAIESASVDRCRKDLKASRFRQRDRKKFGDLDDAYVSLCARDRDPFVEDVAEFQARALALWDASGPTEEVTR